MFGANSWITITVFPPRCAFSRRKTTRPNFDGLATPSIFAGDGVAGPAGKPSVVSAANGLLNPAPVGERSSFCFLAIRAMTLLHHRLRDTPKIFGLRVRPDDHRLEQLAALQISVRKMAEPRPVRQP